MSAPYSRRAGKLLGAPMSEHETPRANADFESRAYREPGTPRWLGWAIVVAFALAMVLAPVECYVVGAC